MERSWFLKGNKGKSKRINKFHCMKAKKNFIAFPLDFFFNYSSNAISEPFKLRANKED